MIINGGAIRQYQTYLLETVKQLFKYQIPDACTHLYNYKTAANINFFFCS